MRPARPPSSRWLLVFVAAVGVMVGTMDATAVPIALPRLADALAVDASTILWVGIIYLLTVAGLLFTMGWVGDVAGRRAVYAGGFAVFALGLALAAAAPNVWALLGARVVQGVGGAMTAANEYAVLAAVFPPRERAKAVGFQGTGVGLGLALGPLVGGVVLDHLDWRALFYLRVPHALLVALLALWVVRDEGPARAGGAPPDVPGAALLFATMGSFLLAVNQFGRAGLGSPVVWGAGAAFLVLLPLFVAVERRAAMPVLDLSLFRARAFRLATLCAIGFYVARSSVDYLTPFYLQNGLGYAATTAGLFMFTFHILRMVGSPVAGTLGTWLTARTISSAALVVLGLGVLALARVGEDPSVGALVLALVLAGAGAASFEAPNTAAILNAAPAERRGAGSAAVATARQLGQSSGAALAGALYAAQLDRHLAALVGRGLPAAEAAPTATVLAYGAAMGLPFAFAGLALVASLVRPGGWVRAREPAVASTGRSR